ncbi:unnamed protein product [Polarella glacialis]|uniref:Uncharacterized protein n=1 Tax=Polarella glacialis TaxID=89957 RepID=A0A813KA19_POLGL|nr:unnamed protein product [Polarella glacialis]CAE8716640.1 unnamed protein product [Polarella glacialis]|mmetsp:Transcript_14268/g.22717  ORF Transcript_14268/g.22717 Transcript_14268/m.22717 type:complete len:123 (+) Transcript_14268:109-477(+)
MASRRSSAVFLALFLFVAALPAALGSFLASVEAFFGVKNDEDAKEVGLPKEEITRTFGSLDSDKDSKLSKAEPFAWDDFLSKEELANLNSIFVSSLRAMAADEIEAHLEDGEIAEHKFHDEN